MAYNSDNFDLSNWKITLPVDSKGGTSGVAVEVKNLIGYEDSKYFYDAPDGAMVFSAMADGATTSGSKYARSELREMNGSDRAAWKLSEGGTMTATLEVDKVPQKDGGPGKIVIGQIHGQDEELVRLYYENGKVYFVNDRAGSNNDETTFALKDASGKEPNISLNEKFSYKIDAKGDALTVEVYADGQTYTSTSKINSVWQSDSFYFKAGAYLGVNEGTGSGSGQVSFYDLDFGHTKGSGLGGLQGQSAKSASTSNANSQNTDSQANGSTASSSDTDKQANSSASTTAASTKDSVPASSQALKGDSGNNSLSGTEGNDVIRANGGNDKVYGRNGNDELHGNSGNDKLYGDAGDDRILGTSGGDVLQGGPGKDLLEGGSGTDKFVFTSLEDAGDTIADFRAGDVIDITALMEKFSGGGNDMSLTDLVSNGFINYKEVGDNTHELHVDADGAKGAAADVTLVTVVGIDDSVADAGALVA